MNLIRGGVLKELGTIPGPQYFQICSTRDQSFQDFAGWRLLFDSYGLLRAVDEHAFVLFELGATTLCINPTVALVQRVSS